MDQLMIDLAYVPMGIAIIAIVFVILIFCIGDANGIYSVSRLPDDGSHSSGDSGIHCERDF